MKIHRPGLLLPLLFAAALPPLLHIVPDHRGKRGRQPVIRAPGGNSDDRLSLADQAREIEITPFLLGSVVDRNPQTAAVADHRLVHP